MAAPRAPYEQRVDAASKRNPCLSALKSFLEQRLPSQPQRITLLEFIANHGANQAMPTSRDLQASDIRTELVVTNNQNNPASRKLGKIFVIEDIAKETVEELGSQLDIDPWFFATYIHHTWRRRLQTLSPQNCTLPSREQRQKFMSLHYHQSLDFNSLSPQDVQLLKKGNHDRKVLVLPKSQGSRIGLAQHTCSVLLIIRTNAPWIGIILVDAGPSKCYISQRRPESRSKSDSRKTLVQVTVEPVLFAEGYENFSDIAAIPANNATQAQPRSMLDDLVRYWCLDPPAMFDPNQPTLQALTYLPLKIVAAEWLMYIAVMSFSIRDLEPSSYQNSDFQKELDHLSSDLRVLQSWRRRVLATQEKMRQSIRFFKQHSVNGNGAADWSALLEDYEFLSSSIDDHGQRLESIVPVVTSMVQLVESRRALAETYNVTRLTVLAFVFIPLSFVASLFSINDTWKPGTDSFWVYWAVAVPLTLFVLLVAAWCVHFVSWVRAKLTTTKSV